jgi:hypothetical protein
MLTRHLVLFGLLAGFTLTAQTNPAPLVNDPLVPTSVAPGSGGFALTVSGTGFVTGSVVNWNASPRVTNFVGGSQVRPVLATVTWKKDALDVPPPGGQASVWLKLVINRDKTRVINLGEEKASLDFLGFTLCWYRDR